MKLPFLQNLLFLLLVLSCDNLNMDSPRILDETPPVVHITYPANQSIVSGSVLFELKLFNLWYIPMDRIIKPSIIKMPKKITINLRALIFIYFLIA